MALLPLLEMPLYIWLHCLQTLLLRKLRTKYHSTATGATIVVDHLRRLDDITLMLTPPSLPRTLAAMDNQPGRLSANVARKKQERLARPPTTHPRPRLSLHINEGQGTHFGELTAKGTWSLPATYKLSATKGSLFGHKTLKSSAQTRLFS